MTKYLSIFFPMLIFGISFLEAKTVKVNSITSLQQAINAAKPGDRIVVANGVYTTSESIVIKNSGTSVNRITIEAESIGGVEITGTNGFVIAPPSSYIIIKGFRLSHKTGTNTILAGATHCVITRNLFECVPVNAGTKPYLNVSGDDNEISFNTFQNKMDEGQMLSIQGPDCYKITDPRLVTDKNGVYHSSISPDANPSYLSATIPETNRPQTISEVGPDAL